MLDKDGVTDTLPTLGVIATVDDTVPLKLSVAVAGSDTGCVIDDDGHAKLNDARCVPSMELSGDNVPSTCVIVRVPVAATEEESDRLDLGDRDDDPEALGNGLEVRDGAARRDTVSVLPPPGTLADARCVPSMEFSGDKLCGDRDIVTEEDGHAVNVAVKRSL